MNDDTERHEPSSQAFVPVCAIGASAGGVTALQGLFRQVPDNLGLAYVVILHLSPDQPSVLSEILSVCTRMPVLQIEDGPTLKPNCVYVIPPDRELVIAGDSVTARPFSEPRGSRAPVDMFFRSVAAARGDGIAMILSGAGADGSVGVRAVKEAGGVIMVQEPAEAGFASMPQNAIATGVADFVAPLVRLAERLAEVARSKEAVRSLDMDGSANDLRRIVAFLRARTGHDFSFYKRATVMRRVLRRMQVCRTDTLADYANHLLATPEEAKELFSDLLISVTMFFRDPRAFQALERHVVGPLFDDLDLTAEEILRVWVVGCATGEEAYSVAMLLHEEAARRKLHPQVQVFASDLDEGALATAREGRYPRSIEADVSEGRLARFFVDEGTHYRVRKELRESVLFAAHSAIKDPPFSRLDLITCRNLLIYLERALQQQLCSIFHYSLRPGRYLFLGSAETADVATELFAPLDREARLYCTRPQVADALPVLPQFAPPGQLVSPDRLSPVRIGRAALPAALHASALERGAPASALVDGEQNILHLSPNAGRFILHSAGPLSSLLPAVVRPELRLDLRLALSRALDGKEPTFTHPTPVATNEGRRRIALHVMPVPGEAHMGAQALVFFLDGGAVPEDDAPQTAPDTRPDEVRRLHAELRAAQDALLDSRTGQDAAVQDLRASNEELQSTNEEYRSTAEELETSKEELQSINEELHTVNAELKSKLASISVAHSDLQNLTMATEIGTLFLDPDLRIRMSTPPIAELFNVTQADVGRTVTDFTHRLEYEGLAEDARRVLRELVPVEAEVRSRGGRWYAMRLRPYRTVEDRIDGTVVTFVDITARREAEAALREGEARHRAELEEQVRERTAELQASRDLLQATMNSSMDMIQVFEAVRDAAGEITDFRWLLNNHASESIYGEVVGKRLLERNPGVVEEDIFDTFKRVTETGEPDQSERHYVHEQFDGWFLQSVVKLGNGVATTTKEITEWKRAQDELLRLRDEVAQAKLRESEERLRQFGEASSDVLWIRDAETLRWEYLTPAFEAIYGLGREQALDGDDLRHWAEFILPEDREQALRSLERVRDGERVAFEYRIRRASDGEVRWVRDVDFPMRDGAGRVVRIGGIGRDVTEEKQAAERMGVLVAELQHRTRNLLAVVRTVARRSIDPSPGRDEYDARLAALGRVQGFLSRSPDYQVPLADLVAAELTASGDGVSEKVVVGGPAVELPGEDVQAVALALHELATNALKYGALAQASGRLSVTWRLEAAEGADGAGQHLVIEWQESGVAMPDEPPSRRGYGSELITKALPYQLRAETALEFTHDGVHCRITLPTGAFRTSEERQA